VQYTIPPPPHTNPTTPKHTTHSPPPRVFFCVCLCASVCLRQRALLHTLSHTHSLTPRLFLVRVFVHRVRTHTHTLSHTLSLPPGCFLFLCLCVCVCVCVCVCDV